jgi:hypothetical protein
MLEAGPYDTLIGTTSTFKDGNGEFGRIALVNEAFDESR